MPRPLAGSLVVPRTRTRARGRCAPAAFFVLLAFVIPVALVVALVLAATPSFAGPLTSEGTQPPLTHDLLPSTLCGACHGGYSATEYPPWDSWAGSMMAQASRDPIFWAALDVANHDIPDVGDWCLRCHTPTGWLAGRSELPGGTADGCGLNGPIDQQGNDFDGVTCHLCHRMMVNDFPPLGQDSLYFENGAYWVDDTDCDGAGEPCRRGPYDYPADGLYPPPHAWEYSALHEQSALCANCHNVTSPVKTMIESGVDTGIPFPIERTSDEWAASAYGDPFAAEFTSCQGCHMPQESGTPVWACNDLANDHTGDFARHEFAGGNAWIPNVLRQEYPMLGLGTQLARTRDWALDMLQNRSATVEVTAPDTIDAGQNLAFDVKVTNLTGHKLPTGYPEGRRMWLNVQVRDGLNQLVWESGAYHDSTGVLVRDAQAKVYEVKQGIWNLNGTNECDCEDAAGSEIFHFVLNDCVELDNRIPPKGFSGMGDPELEPKGYSYPETSPGSGELVNFDTTSYGVAIPHGTVTPITVSATLRYQTTSKEYVEFLLDEAVDNAFPDDCIPRTSGLPNRSRAKILHEMWTTYDRCPPVDMTTDAANTEVLAVTSAPSIAAISSLTLAQNAPNPMRPTSGGTVIAYHLPGAARVKLEILDVRGRHVRTLTDEFQEFGPHSAGWDARDDLGRKVAAGVYLYRLEAAGRTLTKRMILLR